MIVVIGYRNEERLMPRCPVQGWNPKGVLPVKHDVTEREAGKTCSTR